MAEISNDVLRLIFDAVPALIWLKDKKGTYLQVNKAYCDTVGLSREAILGKTDYDLYPKDIADQYVNYDRKVLNTGVSEFGIEEHHLKPSGKYGFSLTDKLIYKDDLGNILGTMGFALDITERKFEQEAIIKVNEAFMSFGTDATYNLNAITQAAGNILKAICVLYNRKEGEWLKTQAGWQIPPDLQKEDRGKGHICFDVIEKGGDQPVVIRDLENTEYAKTDPNVKKYNLKTYISYPVKLGEEPVASLCAVYQEDFIPTPFQLNLLQMLGKAASIEEERKQAEDKLKQKMQELEDFFELSVGRELKMKEMGKEVDSLLKELGRKPKYE